MPIPIKPKLDNPVRGIAADSQLALIEHWAKEVPKNGIVVEVGSFTGRSAWHWANAVDPSVKVYCIDKWDPEYYKPAYPHQLHGRSTTIEEAICSLDVFKSNTKDCPNIIPIQAHSPDIPAEMANQLKVVDAVYIDDSHFSPDFDKNFMYWFARLRAGGIMCGDDFNKRDVARFISVFATKYRFQVYVRSNYWRIFPFEEKIDLND